jgi:hypothetical protein
LLWSIIDVVAPSITTGDAHARKPGVGADVDDINVIIVAARTLAYFSGGLVRSPQYELCCSAMFGYGSSSPVQDGPS